MSTGHTPRLSLELYGIARRMGKRYRRADKRLFLTDIPLWRLRELAYAKVVGEYMFSFRRVKELPQRVREWRLKILRRQPFAVRGALAREVGWWFDGRVDLERPRYLIYVHRAKKYHVIGDAKIIKGKDFEARDVKHRPFFHPASMNARFARFLVNAAGVMPDDVVLDPFCGAGGILLEAGMVGAEVVGVDIDERMVRGCRENLNYYGLKGKVIHGDARRIDITADVIVTDPPYGRSSRRVGELREALENLYNLAEHLVIVLPTRGDALLEGVGFRVERVLKIAVHSSLTRWVHVCSR